MKTHRCFNYFQIGVNHYYKYGGIDIHSKLLITRSTIVRYHIQCGNDKILQLRHMNASASHFTRNSPISPTICLGKYRVTGPLWGESTDGVFSTINTTNALTINAIFTVYGTISRRFITLWILNHSNTAYGQTNQRIIRCFILKFNFANLRVLMLRLNKLFLLNSIAETFSRYQFTC